MGYMLQKEERRMGGGNVSQDQTSIICIDLKSFYASVECVERGLDPFKTNLVVADPTRSKSTICLAITPAMKSLGIKNRCRIHEIPDCVKYITAMPRMQLYMDYSAKIYGIYLRKHFLLPPPLLHLKRPDAHIEYFLSPFRKIIYFLEKLLLFGFLNFLYLVR
jgi:DNA polymerase V